MIRGNPAFAGVAAALLFAPRAGAETTTTPPSAGTSSPSTPPEPAVEVRAAPLSTRGVGDLRLSREVLDASPRQHTSEMLSAAPGFFVDHEDGEGLGNDVYLRGWDLEHASGIEMRVGSVPVNVPSHIRAQGYADVNFIIPEVVRSIRVLQGPYDPRQGDAAIVGSAYFDLGVPERGYRLATSYGSFGQKRFLAIVAPEGMDDDTFAAFALRSTDGFGDQRASRSGSANAQYAMDLGANDRIRVIATAYASSAELPGVVREDDVEAGRIGFYDRYPYFAASQSVRSARMILGGSYEHTGVAGARVVVEPWAMWTDFRARQNFAGALETSQNDPSLSGLGDLFQTANAERAGGATVRYRTRRATVAGMDLGAEPGLSIRYGRTDQGKQLLEPDTLRVWDRRLDATLSTLDVAGYVDVDARLSHRVRVSGGLRADLLVESIDDRAAAVVQPGMPPGPLSGAQRDAAGVAMGPRVTAEYQPVDALSVVTSYGEGFRSLDAAHVRDGSSKPYSKVRSVEAGLRARDLRRRYTTTLAVFDTWVGNELVFVAEAGGLETEGASTRRGVVGSFLAKPREWLLASSSVSVTDAVFLTRIPGISHHVPNVPPLLFRADVTVRGRLFDLARRSVTGRVGVGYTFLSGRHLTDAIVGPSTNLLNVGAGLRYGAVELDVDAFNVLGLRYADEAEAYISNWSLRPGQQRASVATHYVAAPPRTILGTLALRF